MAGKKGKGVDKVVPVEDYEHSAAKRTNNPPAGLAHLDRDKTPVKTLSYDPHLDPQLVWAGKEERSVVEVPAPSIHVHEELSAQKIIDSVRRQRTQQPLFDVDKLDPDKAVEFYQHDMGWSNRMILGDSLMVMSSLIERERMAGQVQCIYIDPPYGIKYNSNFQPSIGNRSVTDGRDSDLTREPEMIRAFRDTWELGVHSYLTYLRDRLLTSRELLRESGSVFVQIGDDNAHRVRLVLDEVFGADNFVAEIIMQKSGGSTATLLPRVADMILWYAKDRSSLKYRELYEPFDLADLDTKNFRWAEGPNGERRKLTKAERENPRSIGAEWRPYQLITATSQDWQEERSGPYRFKGEEYLPGKNRHWSLSNDGLDRLAEMDRLEVLGTSLRIRRYLDDFPVQIIKNVWTDTGRSGFGEAQRYVVQTNPKAIERCVLMSSDPGDLVIDPTCGSGTTALVAEKHGRRWVTVDTSRVALAIARERLLSTVFDFYQLVDGSRGVDAGLVYKQVERIQPSQLASDEEPASFPLFGEPVVDRKRTRVSGPFTVESVARYSEHPDLHTTSTGDSLQAHVDALLDALRSEGLPRPNSKPLAVESLLPIATTTSIHAEGTATGEARQLRFGVSVGPQFGAVTMAQVSDALREAVGFDLVVFVGYAFTAEAQDRLSSGRIGSVDVSLLLANPDTLVADLLKGAPTSQTFRLYMAPDIQLQNSADGWFVSVEGVDSFDAATGEVVSFGRSGIQAWFLDSDFDGTVFRVSQALFPVTNAWEKLQKALRGTVDAERVDRLHGWESLPFDSGDHGRIAVRVVADDGNASEVVLELPKGS